MVKVINTQTSLAKPSVNVLLFVIAGVLLALLLIEPFAAIEYMKKGLQLCAHSVVPSLFPFMIISEIIVESGVGKRVSTLISPLTKKLFGVINGGTFAFVLGTVCGFPIGARAAASMYDKGDMTRQELERTLTFCNNPSPAFIISTVGASIIGNRTAGVVIYVCVMLSAVTVGIFTNIFMHKDSSGPVVRQEKDTKSSPDMAQTFTLAIRSAVSSMLNVCAYVTFFSAIVGCMGKVLVSLGMPQTVGTLLFGFFELSSGAASASNLGNTFLSAVACATFAGWSGMSIHFQIISVAGGRGISFKPYILAKAVQGIICGALAAVALKFFFPTICAETSDAFGETVGTLAANGGMQICLGFITASILPFFVAIFDKKEEICLDKRTRL